LKIVLSLVYSLLYVGSHGDLLWGIGGWYCQILTQSLMAFNSCRRMLSIWVTSHGFWSHSYNFDFVTIDPVEVLPTTRITKPAVSKLYDWIRSWN
jgi:hypothetical protein